MKLALALVALLVAGCGSAGVTPDVRTGMGGCSLLQFHGNLVPKDGEPVIETLGDWGDRTGTVLLDWPNWWTIRPTGHGHFEIRDKDGSVLVRTGTHVILETYDYLSPYNEYGELIVCAANPYDP